MAKKYGYEAYLEDQKKREEEAKKGQVRYVEAAKASRIQYTLPQYKGKSENQGKTYQWERDLMADTKIKGAGNSYTKKFNALTKSMGMTEGQASEFRKFMDFQEDSQHVDPKLNKDKTIKENQALKYARDARLKTDLIDGILDNMHKTGASKVANAGNPTAPKKKEPNKVLNGLMKAMELIDRPGDAVRTGIKEKAEGRSFWEGAKDGLTGEKNTSGTEVNKLIGLDPEKNENQRNVSEIINSNLLNTFGVGMAINAFAPDKAKEYAATQTPGAATEVLLDPLNLLGGGASKGVRKGLSLPAQLEDVLNATGTIKYSDEALESALKEAYAPKGDPSNVLADPVKQDPQHILEQLTGTFKKQPELKINNWQDNAYKKPAVDEQAVADDYLMDAHTRRQAAEDDFIQQELAPHFDSQKQAAQAQETWENVVKQAKKDIENIKQTFGKIHVPKGAAEDYPIPPQFRATYGDKASDDIFSFADQMGFSSPDEAIAYLRQLDADSKTRLKDLMPADHKPFSEDDWANLESGARQKFTQTEQGKALDRLITDLIEGNTTSTPLRTIENAPTPGLPQNMDELIRSFKENPEVVNNSQALEPVEPISSPPKPQSSEIEEPVLSTMRSDTPFSEMSVNELKDLVNGMVKKWQSALDDAAAGRPNLNLEGYEKDAYALRDYYDKRKALEDTPSNQFQNQNKAPEEILDELVRTEGNKKLTVDELNSLIRGEQPKMTEPTPQTDEEAILRQLLEDNEDWGQAPSMSDDALDNFLSELEGKPRPKVETEAVNPAPVSEEVAAGKEPLLRTNLQQFSPSTATSLVETRAPISTESPITKINNPVKRVINKFYEGYVNRNHSAKVTEVQSLESAIKRAQAEGKPKKAAQLQQRLKTVKKSGSDFDKALGNELASGAAAQNFLNRHFDSLSKTMGGDMKEMSGALEFQMAKNLDYIKRNVDPDYELPAGWDWNDITGIINDGANNAKYGEFINQFRNMTQEWRDTMLDYGLISKESHEALGQNPYYIPMQRDMSQVFDNIDVGYAGIGDKGRGAGNGIVKSLDGGSVETFFKNPLETVIDHSFKLYKNAFRNDTAQQALKMAELDKDGSLGLAKEVSERNKKPGDLTVFVNGQKRYVRLQDDLVKMMNENESTLDLGKIGKATQLFAALKTRSFEYQTAAAPRDMVQAYVTSQVSNPIRYVGEVFKAIKNKNASAKEVGAYFDKAYNDHVAGVDPKKVLKEFQQKAGNVKVFSVKDPESWKQVGGIVKKILDTPFKPSKFLGQITDEIPREIEVKEAERLFMKKNGQKMQNIQAALDDVNAQIEAAQGAPDFSPDSFGIEQLMHQRDKMENMLRQFNQDLKREKVYRGRDVMDYSRMGNSKATKNIIRPWVIFANTTTQSKDKIIRSFIERPGATIAKATSVVAPFVAAEVINHDTMNDSDRKMYDNLPDYIKEFNYIYIKNGTTYAVPKLQELALITNPIEAALKGDSLDDSISLLMRESLPYQSGMIAQGFGPRDKDTTPTQNMQLPSTVFSPGVDIIANKKLGFNQKPISFGGFYKGADAPANEWTMEMFKKLMGDNPGADKTQYGIQQYGGDAGKYATYSLDALLDPSNQGKIDEMLRNLNPFQDRMFKENSRYFKTTPQETKK